MDAICRGIEDCRYLGMDCRHMDDQVRQSGCPWQARAEDEPDGIPAELNFDD